MEEVPETFVQNLGRECDVRIVGYANDGRNEGLQAALDNELMPMYQGSARPHITVSYSDGARAVDTGSLQFEPVDDAGNRLTLRGRFGYFTGDHVAFDM